MKRVLGILLVIFVLTPSYFLFSSKIKDGSAKEWNAAPFIFAESFLLVLGVDIILRKKQHL